MYLRRGGENSFQSCLSFAVCLTAAVELVFDPARFAPKLNGARSVIIYILAHPPTLGDSILEGGGVDAARRPVDALLAL